MKSKKTMKGNQFRREMTVHREIGVTLIMQNRTRWSPSWTTNYFMKKARRKGEKSSNLNLTIEDDMPIWLLISFLFTKKNIGLQLGQKPRIFVQRQGKTVDGTKCWR